MVKKQGVVWNYYTKKENGTQVIAFCKFCDQSYIKNATRMERHMERCPKCPEDIRQQFIKVAHNKKAKANIFSIKVNEIWPKQELIPGSEAAARQDVVMDNLEHWEYQNQNSSGVMNPIPRTNVHYVIPNQSQWVAQDQNLEPEHVDVGNLGDDKEWSNGNDEAPDEEEEEDETNQLEDVDIEEDQKPERSSPVLQSSGGRLHQRKSYAMRRVSQWPNRSLRGSGLHSGLQNKIHEEQLMERRALRRVAELELRRKTLELERFQWEFQRDKAHSELRWAHETRMMQLNEERERLAIEQSRARGPVTHVS